MGEVDFKVSNLGIGSFQQGLSHVVNTTYSYSNSTLFAAIGASYYRDYLWRLIRPAVQWLDGYVPSIHYPDSGIMSTRVASSLINGISRTIVGEKLIFRISGEKNDKSKDTLRFISRWATKQKIKRPIKNAVAYMEALGTSLLKMNEKNHQDVWWEAIRLDNCFFLADASGEVKEATFLIKSYTDTRRKTKDGEDVTQFYLAEKRYWRDVKPEIKKVIDPITQVESFVPVHKKGDKEPVVEYQVYRANAHSLNNLMASADRARGIGWTEIPKEIQDLIKADYSVIRINEAQKLPFASLGVKVLVNDEGDISIPTGYNFGRGMIYPIIDDLIIYEVAEAYALRDMYNGKGTVYKPQALSMGNFAIPQSVIKPSAIPADISPDGRNVVRRDGSTIGAIDSPATFVNPIYASPLEGVGDKYETVPGMSPEQQQLLVNQFELRVDQWQMIQDNALRRIATKWGMSPKVLSSYLVQGSTQMTATQIDSEDDISIAFIEEHRSSIVPVINELIEETLNYYGHDANVNIDFASPSLVNKDRLLDRAIKMLDAGLIDVEEAIHMIFPDEDEETLESKVQAAKNKQEAMMMASYQDMNSDGTFGNNYEDNGGANLYGSTNPLQS